MLILVLALLLAVPSLVLGRSGGAQAQGTGGTWASGAAMPTARRGLALVAASNGKLYAAGGRNAGGPLNTVEAHTPPGVAATATPTATATATTTSTATVTATPIPSA